MGVKIELFVLVAFALLAFSSVAFAEMSSNGGISIEYGFYTEPQNPVEGNNITVFFEMSSVFFGKDLKKASEAVVSGKTIEAVIESSTLGSNCVTTLQYIAPYIEKLSFSLGALPAGEYAFNVMHKKIVNDCDASNTATVEERTYTHNFLVRGAQAGGTGGGGAVLPQPIAGGAVPVGESTTVPAASSATGGGGSGSCPFPPDLNMEELVFPKESVNDPSKKDYVPDEFVVDLNIQKEVLVDSNVLEREPLAETEAIATAVPTTATPTTATTSVWSEPICNYMDCEGFGVEFEDKGLCSTSVPAPGTSVKLKDMVYARIEKTLWDALNDVLETNPEQTFHLKVSMMAERTKWEKFSSMFEKVYNLVIRKIDKDDSIMYLDVQARRIPPLSQIWGVSFVEFDPAFELPSSQQEETALESQGINQPSLTPLTTPDLNTEQKPETIQPANTDANGLESVEGQVMVSRDEALQEVQNKTNSVVKEVELKLDQETPVYEIKAVQKAKLFWLIPVEMEIKTTVNAQTGAIEKIERPWWGFLAG